MMRVLIDDAELARLLSRLGPKGRDPLRRLIRAEAPARNLAPFDRLDFEASNNRDSDFLRQLHGGSAGPRAPPGRRGKPASPIDATKRGTTWDSSSTT